MNEHLTELDYDRLRLEPRDADPTYYDHMQAHLASCADCRAAAEARLVEDAAFSLAPRVRPLTRPRPRARWPKALAATGAALALAAAIFLVVRPKPIDDVLVPRGAPFDFEVHAFDGKVDRVVVDGAEVHAGERLGFAVAARNGGFVVVFGWDDSRVVWLGYPDDGKSAALAPASKPVPLPGAVELDASPGHEHVGAIVCESPFTIRDFVPDPVDQATLERRVAEHDCALRLVTLRRAP